MSPFNDEADDTSGDERVAAGDGGGEAVAPDAPTATEASSEGTGEADGPSLHVPDKAQPVSGPLCQEIAGLSFIQSCGPCTLQAILQDDGLDEIVGGEPVSEGHYGGHAAEEAPQELFAHGTHAQ